MEPINSKIIMENMDKPKKEKEIDRFTITVFTPFTTQCA